MISHDFSLNYLTMVSHIFLGSLEMMVLKHLLRLGAAIRPGSRFGQVLLMVILRVVKGRQGPVEVGGRHNFGGDARSLAWR